MSMTPDEQNVRKEPRDFRAEWQRYEGGSTVQNLIGFAAIGELDRLRALNAQLEKDLAEVRHEHMEFLKHRRSYLPQYNELHQEYAKLGGKLEKSESLNAQLLEALKFFVNLVDESAGVHGFHLNGDLEGWNYWPQQIEIAREAIALAEKEGA